MVVVSSGGILVSCGYDLHVLIVLYNCLLSTDARIEILFHALNYQFLN